MSLFQAIPDRESKGGRPLADRMRPRTLDEFVGQEHILAPGKPLRLQIERDDPGSIIFWGPPGVGKTTLAQIIAHVTKAEFIEFSAVLSGNRFNRAQQDAFLHHVEHGNIRLIGATTENPSFEINGALLSRCRVYILNPLTEEQIVALLQRALQDTERGLGKMKLTASAEVLQQIASYSSGDARSAYNVLEVAAATAGQNGEITPEILKDTLQKRVLLYDKSGEEHYNLISALHKSMRNSDPDATVYWLARMVEAGEDPLYIARRLVRFASEDIGNADPQALTVAVAAKDAVHFIGMPEGNTALAQAALYLATAPKSNAVYEAYSHAAEDAHNDVAQPVPLHLRNAPTKLMKDLEYGKGYKYAHNEADAIADMSCLPSALEGRKYYEPKERGFEKEIKRRLDGWEEIKRRRKAEP